MEALVGILVYVFIIVQIVKSVSGKKKRQAKTIQQQRQRNMQVASADKAAPKKAAPVSQQHEVRKEAVPVVEKP